MRLKNKAFTLVELLVVISIIALLLAVLIPALSKARKVARRTVCASSMRQVSMAIMLYVNDHKRTPTWGWQFNEDNWPSPTAAQLKAFVKAGKIWPYVKSETVFLCADTPPAKKPGRYGHCPNWWGWGVGEPRWTYTMNCTPGWNNDPSRVLANGLPDWGVAPESVKPSPSGVMLFFEQNMQDFLSYDNSIGVLGVYNISTADPKRTWTSTTGDDTPAYYHSNGSNIAYYDGRVKWGLRRDYLNTISTKGGFTNFCGPSEDYKKNFWR